MKIAFKWVQTSLVLWSGLEIVYLILRKSVKILTFDTKSTTSIQSVKLKSEFYLVYTARKKSIL